MTIQLQSSANSYLHLLFQHGNIYIFPVYRLSPSKDMLFSRPRLTLLTTTILHTLHSTSAFNLQQPLFSLPITTTNMTRAPVIAISHGGGPMPLLGDPDHAEIVSSLRNTVPNLLHLNTPSAPRAILVVTAHWSEPYPTISSGSSPKLYFDYSGFPPETYKLKYNAPGSPSVAQEVAAALSAAGLHPQLDDERGWDHGVFVPLLLIAPEAQIPIVQLSVLDSEDAATHLAYGRALRGLRDSGVAIVASGFASFHNLRLLFGGRTGDEAFKERNRAWSERVGAAVGEKDEARRAEALAAWREFPGAYEMHPRGAAEHFLPLLVAAGAGGEGEARSYKDVSMGLDMWSYYWE